MAALTVVGAIMTGCSSSEDSIADTPQPATQKDNVVTMKTTRRPCRRQRDARAKQTGPAASTASPKVGRL